MVNFFFKKKNKNYKKQASKKLNLEFDFRFDWIKQENVKIKQEKEKPPVKEIQNNIANDKVK